MCNSSRDPGDISAANNTSPLLLLTEASSVSVSCLSLVAIPVYVKQNISFLESGSCGRLDITIGPKQTMGKMVEGLMVTIPMPKSVLSVNLAASQGTYTFDMATKVISCSFFFFF